MSNIVPLIKDNNGGKLLYLGGSGSYRPGTNNGFSFSPPQGCNVLSISIRRDVSCYLSRVQNPQNLDTGPLLVCSGTRVIYIGEEPGKTFWVTGIEANNISSVIYYRMGSSLGGTDEDVPPLIFHDTYNWKEQWMQSPIVSMPKKAWRYTIPQVGKITMDIPSGARYFQLLNREYQSSILVSPRDDLTFSATENDVVPEGAVVPTWGSHIWPVPPNSDTLTFYETRNTSNVSMRVFSVNFFR